MANADMNNFRAATPAHLKPSTTPRVLPSNKVCMTIDGTVVTSNLQQWLRDNYNSLDISAYIQKRMGLSTQDME
eukprot:13158568-Ditylum_brightwellii.AAC.1